MTKKMPMQPLVWDDHGVIRFRKNKIVEYLLDAGPFDLNHLALLPGITKQEHMQFAQLIGYSVSGFGDLSYAKNKMVRKADKLADKMGDDRPRMGEGKDL